ncbi:MAG TPA: DUF4918 family protein [Prolixibacteraceae bacterium]|nr:DUF4918 family protein [Prolixibacteraceae bacterium]HQN93228.1 DUF4918 family protein [Prolixibacteraceae bacterium]HUM88152.1 DUF4918 family protein [Prolixibacteraceae bacterium]
MNNTLADRIIEFNRTVSFNLKLPHGISIMNPFNDNPVAMEISSMFYKKYYNDNLPRHLILGINPGRFGAGVTGIPFTDTKHIKSHCGLTFDGKETHEPSSVFVYEVIDAFGSPEHFYSKFYINSVCPLGFTATDKNGREKNYNYYDSKELTKAVYDFCVENIRQQIGLGINTDLVFCFGTGKNEKFLREVNQKYHFFNEIIALEHPRFIMQYKARTKQEYIEKYLRAYSQAMKK